MSVCPFGSTRATSNLGADSLKVDTFVFSSEGEMDTSCAAVCSAAWLDGSSKGPSFKYIPTPAKTKTAAPDNANTAPLLAKKPVSLLMEFPNISNRVSRGLREHSKMVMKGQNNSSKVLEHHDETINLCLLRLTRR